MFLNPVPSLNWTIPTNIQTVPVRLLYLIGNLGPGGLQRQLYYLLKTMNRARYHPGVVVWSFNEQDIYVPEFRALGVPIYAIPLNAAALYKLISFQRLVRFLKPEIIHSYCFYTNIAVKLASLGLPNGQVGSIRNDFVYELGVGGMLGKLNARWPRIQICNSVAASKSIKETKQIFRPTCHFVVHNGLDVESFPFNKRLPSSPR